MTRRFLPFTLAVSMTTAMVVGVTLPAAATLPPAAPAHPTVAVGHGSRHATKGTHFAKLSRVCGSATAQQAACFALRAQPATASTPGAESYQVKASYDVGPSGGYTPSDLWSAYDLGTTASLTTAGAPGTGHIVGIVDAYDAPTMEADLATFDAQYGLPACTTANGCFTKVGQTGASTLPAASGTSGWDGETSLDVEVVHAVCPACSILLVEANSPTNTNLAAAVNTAVSLGATEVTNSYGAAEASNASVQAAYDHPGVVITASAGDDGYYNFGKGYSGGYIPSANTPAAYPNVVAVGGTTLNLNDDGTRASESVWNDDALGNPVAGATGGGCSKLFAAQAWQTGLTGYTNAGCSSDRLVSDISAIGDPITGFDVYDSYSPTAPGWNPVGGTSLSSPVVAAMYALAGTKRESYPAKTLYSAAGAAPSSIYDVTVGGNGYCGADYADCGSTYDKAPFDCGSAASTACNAATGYDGPSGLGAPTGLAAFSPVIGSFTLPSTGEVGTSVSADAGASSSSVDPITSYHWSWGDGTSSDTAGAQTTHTYAGDVRATVTLTASTAAGYANVPVSRFITVGHPEPSSSAAPTITGTTTDLQTLTAHHGTWSHTPTSYVDQWQRCDSSGGGCVAVPGATAMTYALRDNDVGHAFRVVETASNAGGSGAPSTSLPTAPVATAIAVEAGAFGVPGGATAPSVGSHPTATAISPDGTLLAVASQGDKQADGIHFQDNGSISVFTVGADGALTPAPGSPHPVSGAPSYVAFRPDGSTLAVGDDSSGAVDVFDVAPSGGLAAIPGSPFSGIDPTLLAYSPDGSLLASADAVGHIEMYAVDAAGAPHKVAGSPFLTKASLPNGLAWSPSGHLIAISGYNSDNVDVLTVSASGFLDEAPGSPHKLDEIYAGALAWSPGGQLAVTQNGNTNGSTAFYAVADDGSMTEQPGSPVSTPGVADITFDAVDGDAIIRTFGGTVSTYRLTSAGGFTPLPGATTTFPSSCGCQLGYVGMSRDGTIAAVADFVNGHVYPLLRKPVARITAPADGATYTLGQSVPTAFGCTDPQGSGVASCTDSTGHTGSADAGAGSSGAGSLATTTVGAGTYTVTATSTRGLTSTTTIGYTVAPSVPTVTTVSPSTGYTTGGSTPITITGTGFIPGATVSFGGVAGYGVAVHSLTSLTVYNPAHAGGVVDVTVTTTGGTSALSAADHFTFVAPGSGPTGGTGGSGGSGGSGGAGANAPVPSITRLTRSAGPTAGGGTLMVTGSGFTGTPAVHFGATPAGVVSLISPQQLIVRIPAHAAGLVDVRVSTTGGTSAVSAPDRYRYAPRPTVTKVAFGSAKAKVGQPVTITGSGFLAGAIVYVGRARATSVKVLSATKITAKAPSHVKGRITVTVATPGGTSAVTKRSSATAHLVRYE